MTSTVLVKAGLGPPPVGVVRPGLLPPLPVVTRRAEAPPRRGEVSGTNARLRVDRHRLVAGDRYSVVRCNVPGPFAARYSSVKPTANPSGPRVKESALGPAAFSPVGCQ